MTTVKTSEEIENLSPDFSEVEWKVASPNLAKTVDYSSLEPVQKLFAGEMLEIPANTSLGRLYRWLGKQGYSLRRRKYHDILLIWLEPKVNSAVTTTQQEVEPSEVD